MIKQLALVLVLVLGIAGTVFAIQKVTQFNSQAFSIFDFIGSFHASAGDANFDPNLDINGDGIINTLDLLRDRYAQEATRSSETASDSGELDSILDDLNQTEESSPESEFIDPDHL